MGQSLWVIVGSALGGLARYWISVLSVRAWGDSFPWGTILINVAGSFIIGFYGTLTMPDGAMPASPTMRTFVMIGICGGFTTFSSFSLQTLLLARAGAWLGASANVVVSVVLCLAGVTLGHLMAARLGVGR